MAWRLEQPIDAGAVPAWVYDLSAPWRVPAGWEPDPAEPDYGVGFGATHRSAEISYYSARQDARDAWLRENFPETDWRDAVWDIETALGRRRSRPNRAA